ncbi:MAG: hypothetical protein ACD_72C00515G0001, partial [uncultured bacterium]
LFEHGYENIVVVDDGSQDDTAVVANKTGAIVLSHAVNRGQGAALQTGNEFALKKGAEIIVHFDSDDQFNPADINSGIDFLRQKELDIVFGSRFLDNRSQIPFFKKYFILPISRFINNSITGLKLTDVHNGFRVLTKKAAEKIIITQDAMAHNSQIPQLVKKFNLKYGEHPVEVRYFESGQGIAGGFKIIFDLIFEKFSK